LKLKSQVGWEEAAPSTDRITDEKLAERNHSHHAL
jgi:hypothetical protein